MPVPVCPHLAFPDAPVGLNYGLAICLLVGMAGMIVYNTRPIVSRQPGAWGLDTKHFSRPVPPKYIDEEVLYDQELGQIANRVEGRRKRSVVRSWFIYVLSERKEQARQLHYASIETLVEMLNSLVEEERIFFILRVLPDLLISVCAKDENVRKQELILNTILEFSLGLQGEKGMKRKLACSTSDWAFKIETEGEQRIWFYEWISFCLYEERNRISRHLHTKKAFISWLKQRWTIYPKDGIEEYQYYSPRPLSLWVSGCEGLLLSNLFSFRHKLEGYQHCQSEYVFCQQLFGPGKRCLIVGTGWDGDLPKVASGLCGNYIVIDKDFRAVRIARQDYGARVRRADLLELPFKPDSFDAVLGSSVLSYILEDQGEEVQARLAYNFARVTKEGAIIGFASPLMVIGRQFSEKLEGRGIRVICPLKGKNLPEQIY
ncbi:MAG: class I SAM-dependent methyltransferase [Candidatus Omnitrophica bacterium]|nr:class I SAM-dependent methyltransferase [Candidatus Omnitrophota bacterium]